MKTRATKNVILWFVVAVLWVGPALGELTVTVSISGPIDEILPILQYLKEQGIGAAPAGEQQGEPIRLEMHSISSAEQAGQGEAPGAEEAPVVESQPEPEPTLGFLEPTLAPETMKRGGQSLLTVRVSDPDNVVDTVVASFGGQTVDLYDSGSYGDAKARDGIWSRTLDVPGDLAAGELELTITAYDRQADPVLVTKEDGTSEPLALTIAVTVE